LHSNYKFFIKTRVLYVFRSETGVFKDFFIGMEFDHIDISG